MRPYCAQQNCVIHDSQQSSGGTFPQRTAADGRTRSERGVTTIEFSIIALIFFALILTLFDLALYLAARSVMNSAANKAMSVASVVDDLDTECSLLPPANQAQCGVDRRAALAAVVNSARNNSLGTLIRGTNGRILADIFAGDATTPGFEFQVAKNSSMVPLIRAYRVDGRSASSIQYYSSNGNWVTPAVTLRDTLQSQPMEIFIRGTYRSLSPWLPNLNLVGHAVGFREPRFISSYPEFVDCKGQPVPIGTIPATVGYCPCAIDPNNPVLVQGADSNCACISPLVTSGSGASITCSCPNPNQVVDPVTGRCNCPPFTCASNQTINNTTCGCDSCTGFYQANPNQTACLSTCPVTAAEGAARCGGDQYYSPGNCACLDCPQFQDANGDHSACACVLDPSVDCRGAGQIADVANCRCLACGSGTTANADHSACECTLTAASCGPNQIFQLSATSCGCVGCAAGQQANGDHSACIACTLSGASCTGDNVFNLNSCSCVPCTGNFDSNAGHTACICPLTAADCPNGQILNSDCRCEACTGEATANGPRNACVCNLRPSDCGSSQYVGSNCTCTNCPGGQVHNSSNACVCPESAYTACQGGSVNAARNCRCDCPPGEEVFANGGCAPSICCDPTGPPDAGCRPCNWGTSGGSIIEGF